MKKIAKRTSQKKFWDLLSKSKGFESDCDLIRNSSDTCPVSHVANRILKKKKFDSGGWEEAAEEIGLDSNFAAKIVDAADERNTTLRKKLMKTLKLKEEE